MVDASRKAKLEWTAEARTGFSDLFGNDSIQPFPFISYEFFLEKNLENQLVPCGSDME
jgi:hypothetical protein